ncbi:hypothetical protein SBV1_100024 [Verrucomicrobia bacterium]|nr:hypothetical protein SBV1_100024 [Verrucomicrobiota bacterium]
MFGGMAALFFRLCAIDSPDLVPLRNWPESFSVIVGRPESRPMLEFSSTWA